jgi:homoserine dehydrogenase
VPLQHRSFFARCRVILLKPATGVIISKNKGESGLMPEEVINIGMLGMGTVGGGVASILQRNGTILAEKAGAALRLKRVLVRDLSRKRAVELPAGTLTANVEDVLHDDEIEIVIELIGGVSPAREYVLEALRRGKYVVTANKELMALHGMELLQEARRCRRNIFYEASVGGGIPLIRPLKHCLVANRIGRILGIINGTTNYILTRMAMESIEYHDALAAAQAAGFAEADPASDVDGWDAAYKLAILAGIAFRTRVDVSGIYREGIGTVTREDIRYARELGYVIKLLAFGEEIDSGLALWVQPTLIPVKHPLGAVLYELNALFVEGDAGEVMFYGRGAGALPTASAVVADVVDVVRLKRSGLEDGVLDIQEQSLPILPASKLYSRFYLRLQAKDRPGVFAALATAFGDEEVSLDMIIQKRSAGGYAEIVLVTHEVGGGNFNRALKRVKALETVEVVSSVFRVLP